MLRTFLITLLIYATTLTAFAQTTDTPVQTPPTPERPRSVSDWPVATRYALYDHKLTIVTLAEPSTRRTCKVDEITSDSIVCRAKHNQKIIYQHNEIASIVDPPYHAERGDLILFIGVGAIALAGSFFIPLGASVVVRILAGIALWSLAWDDALGSGHNNDILVYQRPNTPLTIHLHA